MDGVILQAPVSDREWYEAQRATASPEERERMDAELAHATDRVQQGKGSTLMPRKEVPGSAGEGNAAAVQEPAMTAYRTWSLAPPAATMTFSAPTSATSTSRRRAKGQEALGGRWRTFRLEHRRRRSWR